MKSMVILGPPHVFHKCPGCWADGLRPGAVFSCDEVIPHFYSSRHAHDAGWRFTRDRRFAIVGQSGSWVCPDCIKKAGLS